MEPAPVRGLPRVVLLTMPGYFGARIINRLAEQTGIQLVGVGLSNRIYRKRSQLGGIVTFQRRTGWRYLLYNAVHAGLSWNLLRMSRRPAELWNDAMNVRYIPDVNAPDMLKWLDELTPDYIVSFFFNQWTSSDVRARARTACLNMHPSLLPALRGPDPVFRALQRGLTQTGLTIHDVAEEIDLGQIRHQESVEIPQGSSMFGLYNFLVTHGSDRLARYLAGDLVPVIPSVTSENHDDYSSFPTPPEVAAFVKGGGDLVRFQEWRSALAEIR